MSTAFTPALDVHRGLGLAVDVATIAAKHEDSSRSEPVAFVAANQRLLRAAAGERLATVNPETVRAR